MLTLRDCHYACSGAVGASFTYDWRVSAVWAVIWLGFMAARMTWETT